MKIELPDGLIGEAEPLSLPQVLRIGANIQFLIDQTNSPEAPQINPEDGTSVLDTLKDLEHTLSQSDLESPVVGEIANFRNDLEDSYEEDDQLAPQHTETLHLKSMTWLNLLEEALKRDKRIPASKTGILDANILVEAPEQLLSAPIWRWLESRPKSDLREACKSMAIGCPTGCVMLSLRAVEHTLRRWHEEKHGTIDTEAWGGVLDRLMNEYADDSKKNDTVLTQLSDLPPVLSNLYYLKEKRNEVGHPERSPDDMEARRTLMIVAATITEIYDEMMENRIDQLDLDLRGIESAESVEELIYDMIVQVNDQTGGAGAPKDSMTRKATELGLDEHEVKDAYQDILMKGKVYEHDGNIIPI